MSYRINWDNGAGACGTFPWDFETDKEAEAYGKAWADEANARDGLTDEEDGYSYEVVKVGIPVRRDAMCCVCKEVPGTIEDESGNLACEECAEGIAEQERYPRERRP